MLSNVGTFLSHAEKWAHEYAIKRAVSQEKNMEKSVGGHMYEQFCSQYTADVAADLINFDDLIVS